VASVRLSFSKTDVLLFDLLIPLSSSATMLIVWEDPIVTETRALRQEMMGEAGNDLDALFAYLQKEQEQYRGRLVRLPPCAPVPLRKA
jgi:hypothetical protein